MSSLRLERSKTRKSANRNCGSEGQKRMLLFSLRLATVFCWLLNLSIIGILPIMLSDKPGKKEMGEHKSEGYYV